MFLIVDDQKDSGTTLERLLRYARHEAVSVTGGAEAVAMLHVRKPLLMILDVNMPTWMASRFYGQSKLMRS